MLGDRGGAVEQLAEALGLRERAGHLLEERDLRRAIRDAGQQLFDDGTPPRIGIHELGIHELGAGPTGSSRTGSIRRRHRADASTRDALHTRCRGGTVTKKNGPGARPDPFS